ncbi:hypothetical protein ACFLZM_03280 [Thermodesulfobacteriota bacterium]
MGGAYLDTQHNEHNETAEKLEAGLSRYLETTNHAALLIRTSGGAEALEVLKQAVCRIIDGHIASTGVSPQ